MIIFEDMSRLSIEISPEEHQQIKALAALQGKSIKSFILGKLFKEESSKESDAAWDDLSTLLKMRIERAQKLKPTQSTFTEIAQQRIEKLKGH